MAGHSKWANIKHRKNRMDAQKGKLFTKLAREIMVAAREGGSDIQANFRLRMAVQKARDANIPNDNIQKNIQKGLGNLDSEHLEEVVYEGYGPGGVAILIEALTDNRNRTVAELRNIFSKNGGNMGEAGCVSWMFKRKGFLVINPGKNIDEDDLMLELLEAGAEDMKNDEESFEIITAPEEVEAVRNMLEQRGIVPEMAELTMRPDASVDINDEETAAKIIRLMEAMEDYDDVQNVYANFNFRGT